MSLTQEKQKMSEENKLETGFYVKKITDLNDAVDKGELFIPESDLSLQVENKLVQFDYKRGNKQKKIIIEPGSYSLVKTAMGVDISSVDFVKRELLTSITNTTMIINEADNFFNNLDIYDELKQPKKRGILLFGRPGMGKSCALIEVSKQLKDRDPGAVIINWPTSELEASTVFKFFTSYSEYDSKCTKLILVIEDIGGGSREGYGPRDAVSSSLLNLLDGVSDVFKLPTLILSTTNHPENLMASLADRPGRFDMKLEIKAPPFQERIQLVEFLAKRSLTEDEKESFNGAVNKGVEDFSIAHLQEIVMRSRLHRKPLDEVVTELLKDAARFKLDFKSDKKKSFGFNVVDDIDD